MSHSFGDLLTQHLHRKHGLSQAKLAAGILQTASIISEMCQGKRLRGPQARERVIALITWLQQQGALTSVAEANQLLAAAGMAPLQEQDAAEALLIHSLSAPAQRQSRPAVETLTAVQHSSVTPPRHNLPTALTPFVGRSEQIAQLVDHLKTQRLLTLTGAGGVGKTRLAQEVGRAILDAERANNPKSTIENRSTEAHERLKVPDGVWFVELASLTDPEAIPQRTLRAQGGRS